MRCIHEAQLHKHNCYITLTYNGEHLPENNALIYEHWQEFMRRLRKAAKTKKRNGLILSGGIPGEDAEYARQAINRIVKGGLAERKVGFYMGGEYGPKYGRPHFHAIIFGLDFGDRKYLKTTPAGGKIYTSKTLEQLWQYGYSSIGNVTFESAAYVARYVMKKLTGDGNKIEQEIYDMETGEIIKRKKPFTQMSRRPGIANEWFDTFKADVYNTGKITIRGHKQYPPRYYDNLYKRIDKAALQAHKIARQAEALAQKEHHTPARLAVQETVAIARTKALQRNLD